MKIGIISFTSKGACINRKLSSLFQVKGVHLSKFKEEGLDNIESSLNEWTKEQFQVCEALVFIGATGIAVRAIAPFIINKAVDPAVLVIDELGKYIIPLLSGHLGGANKLASELSVLIGGTPVVTTATDLEKCFAIDEWAKRNSLVIKNLKVAKHISAALLQGEVVGFMADVSIKGHLPKGLKYYKANQMETIQGPLGIWIGWEEKRPFQETLWLVPPLLTVGIGCKKGTSEAQIERLVKQILEQYHLPIESVGQIVSIDLKKNEEGLNEWANRNKKSIRFFSALQLSQVEGEFTASSFVKQVTGVDNVCERAAVLGSYGGKLLVPKTSLDGVTIAIAIAIEGTYKVQFDETC